MTFRVVNANGVLVMTTKEKSCVPSEADLQDMLASGYKFEINGKQFKTMKKIMDEIKNKE